MSFSENSWLNINAESIDAKQFYVMKSRTKYNRQDEQSKVMCFKNKQVFINNYKAE